MDPTTTFAYNCEQMSIAEIEGSYQRVAKNIGREYKSINLQVMESQDPPSTAKIKESIEEIKEINKAIERKKEEAIEPRRRGCWSHWVHLLSSAQPITKICFAIQVASGVALAGLSVASSVYSTKVDDQVSQDNIDYTQLAHDSEIAKILSYGATGMIALNGLAFIPFVDFLRGSDDDSDKDRLFSNITVLQKQVEKIIIHIESYEAYKRTLSTDEKPSHKIQETQEQSFSQCAKYLDDLVETVASAEKISNEDQESSLSHDENSLKKNPETSRDHWISHLLQLLPYDHPLKVELREIRDAAIEELKQEQPDKAQGDCCIEIESVDEKKQNPFDGEKRASSFSHNVKIKRTHTPVFGKPVQVSREDFRNNYQKKWETIEHRIGVPLNRIQLDDDIAFTRDATLAQNINDLNVTISSTVRDKEEELEIEIE